MQFQRKTDNPGGKQTYVGILRKRSDSNIQRKLSKQDIAENKNNTSIAQLFITLFINRQNKHDYNKPTSAASATSNADDDNTQNTRQNLEEEIKRLKNEVVSLKKHHVTPPQHVIPVQRQFCQLQYQNRHQKR